MGATCRKMAPHAPIEKSRCGMGWLELQTSVFPSCRKKGSTPDIGARAGQVGGAAARMRLMPPEFGHFEYV